MRRAAIAVAIALAACKPRVEIADTARDAAPPTRDVGAPCGDADVLCAPGAKAALGCRDGRLVVTTTCRGPAGCAIDGGLACDDSIADGDDPCDLEGQAACSTDGAAELRCAHGKFARVRVCRKPCEARADEVRCD